MSGRERPQGWGGEVFGIEPVGAVLSNGRKKDGKGFPIEKDRLHIVLPHERDGERPLHPGFSAFNSAAPEKRRRILGQLVHMRFDGAVAFRRQMFRLPTQMEGRMPPPPNRRPQCEGNGRTATRHLETGFEEIRCPGDRCEFAMMKACKPRTEVLFRPVWSRDGLPTPLMMYSSSGEHQLQSLLGFLDYVAGIASAAGLCKPAEVAGDGYDRLVEAQVPAMGLPFSLLLEEKTNREKRTRFPVVLFTAEGDLVEWMMRTQEHIRQISDGRAKLPELPASVRELPDEMLALDSRELQPGLPGVAS